MIVNPAAGPVDELMSRAETSLSRVGLDYELRLSESRDHVAEIVAEGHASGVHKFAGVGGDGTAHLIVNGLMQHEWLRPPGLAVLPAGSGSDFIRTFGLPRTIEAAAPHLTTPDWYKSDVLEVRGSFGVRYALNAVEAGVGAAAVTTAARMPRWVGSRRYALAFWLALPRFRPDYVHALVDGRKEVEGTAIAVVIANGQFFGGGMNVAPRSSVGDGIVDLQVFAGPRHKALTVMPRVIRGMHLRHKNVRRLTGCTIDVQVPESWPIEADGELLGVGPISVSVRPEAIDFKI
ncbi:MAG: diacylglycerol kinase family protein [Actinomycetota bacterium]|nr:diacylglycerol kinase family protein [Actinomycetota bacterium]